MSSYSILYVSETISVDIVLVPIEMIEKEGGGNCRILITYRYFNISWYKKLNFGSSE